MASIRTDLTRELRNAGVTQAAIDAVWPEWWSSDAEQSLSASTELRYTLARRLGIAPTSLFEGRPTFVWRNEAKFKNLGTTTEQEQSILTSFGITVGRALLRGALRRDGELPSPEALRLALLETAPDIGLRTLLRACWALGIPVIKMNLFPLRHKRMQAMTIASADSHAVILGRDTHYPAWVAFILAHELGHIFNGHVSEDSALLDIGDPLAASESDAEEAAADRFALTLLTGLPDFPVQSDVQNYNSAQLSDALARSAPQMHVDPGVLGLCLAHRNGRWPQTFNALRALPDQYLKEDVGVAVNWFASQQLRWDSLTDEWVAYLRAVMGS